MEIPKLQMEPQFAKISIQQKHATLDIHQPKANLEIEQPKADMDIHTKKGVLTIDQSQAWEETNLKSPLRWAEIFAEDGKAAAQSGTARRAEQGAALLDIHLGGNSIQEQAITNGSPPMKTPTVTYIPSSFAVKFSYQPAEVQTEVKTHQVQIQPNVNKPEIHVEKGGVDIGMEQYASLQIEVVPSIINNKL